MRAIAFVAALAALAPLAAAHHAHSPCGSSQTLFEGLHLDAWGGSCVGAAVSFPEDLVVCDGFDAHLLNVHILVLYSDGCQTGVVAQRIEPVPLLP